jgi:hypothetical protein
LSFCLFFVNQEHEDLENENKIYVVHTDIRKQSNCQQNQWNIHIYIYKQRKYIVIVPKSKLFAIQHYVIKFVSDLQQVGGFLSVFWFSPPMKLTATI